MDETTTIHGITVRKMWPKRRFDLPEWELSRDGKIVGYLKQWRASRGGVVFFNLTAFHPETGKALDMGSDTKFDARVAKLDSFLADPMPDLWKRMSTWEREVYQAARQDGDAPEPGA
jgi:hypothetical protein